MPASGGAQKDQAVYNKYKGQSFVVEFDIMPITQKTNDHKDISVSLFTFASAYLVGGSNTFVAQNLVSMSMSDFSLKIGSTSLNYKLKADEFSTLAIHVNVKNNTFDFYVNGTRLAENKTFISSSDIRNKIATYNSSGELVASSSSTKMNDFMFTYARLAQVNAKVIMGDIYAIDNANLYYSGTYYYQSWKH
jgi:hypothetical protein